MRGRKGTFPFHYTSTCRKGIILGIGEEEIQGKGNLFLSRKFILPDVCMARRTGKKTNPFEIAKVGPLLFGKRGR